MSTLRAEATFSLFELSPRIVVRNVASTDNSSNPSGEIWTNKLKNGVFFPVLDRFRALRESCVADQSCRNFFIPAKLAPFDDRPED